MFIHVFGSTYLNPDAVGKFETDVAFADQTRTTVTRVFDLTGQHVLMEASTTVATGPDLTETGLQAVRRDNEVHVQIRTALCNRQDAARMSENLPGTEE